MNRYPRWPWPVAAAMFASACSSVDPGHAGAASGGVRIYGSAAPSASAAMTEYQQLFTARGVGPDWEGEIRPGEARLRVAGEDERIIPLKPPYPCPVVGCEGAWFEQRVSHRHPGANITKGECRLPGSDTVYPYRVTLNLLRSAADREGVMFRGCGMPRSARAD